jgi:hypothetical protein
MDTRLLRLFHFCYPLEFPIVQFCTVNAIIFGILQPINQT